MTKDLSRTLSRVLRHSPNDVGIVLDAAGWTPIDKLIPALRKAGYKVNRESLMLVVETNDKRRFTISSDGLRIRAAQGHSVEVSLGIAPSEPPPVLFHGTASASLNSIFNTGLNPGKRQQVHLSTKEETALMVGGRHGRAVVLKVDCVGMTNDGLKFYEADNGVWLTDCVPPKYLGF